MSGSSMQFERLRGWSVPTLLLCACISLPAAAQAPSSTVLSHDDIERALHPPLTRGFHPSRGLSRREQLPASVNLDIQFDYNSSALKKTAAAQLDQLELALRSDALRNDRFLVAGHTDARGNASYNKQLSRQRAETVKQFLVAHGIAAERLSTVGYGSERLLTNDRPYDAQNRRVEIRDLGASSP